MRVWIAGGGTGGHVYPGLAVLQALEPIAPVDPLYVGELDSVEERLAARAGVPFAGIPAGGLHGVGLRRALPNAVRLARGFRAALRIGRRERPAALFATGGYASVPVAMAAWMLRVPVLLYLPDIEPGLAVRWIARFARRVAVTVEDSRAYFPARKVVVTGYPIRPELAQADRERARGALDLAPNGPVLLVTGGSRGARSINRAVTGNLEELLQVAQTIHLSGELDWPWVSAQAEELPADLRARYRPYPYLHEMGMALAASDVVVSRAGASALGEYPYFRLPAILVPYPHAWRYQRVNAEWLASRGAALHLPDEQLERELVEAVRGLVRDGERRAAMRERLQALAKPDAATRLAVELHTLAQRGAGEEAP